MARQSINTEKQAKDWSPLQIWVKARKDDMKKCPAPPVPDDQWSEKFNILVRTLDGMSEMVAARIEAEEYRQSMIEEQRASQEDDE